MDIYLYNTDSPNNTINKILRNEKHYDITFKDIADITAPLIKIMSEDLMLYNYAYIPDFERYYFIDNIVSEPKNVYSLYLRCDVLESFKNDIINSDCIISKCVVDDYIDLGLQTELIKEHEVFKSDLKLVREKNLILSMFGIERGENNG